jgi:formate dehydrogenase major subunit
VTGSIRFQLDGRDVEARAGETIWQVAQREGIEIPHLCYSDEASYRDIPDGNCRACMVEIDGERALSASCVRHPTPGMAVRTASDRARKARSLVMELLLSNQPERDASPDPHSRIWHWADVQGVSESRFPAAVPVPSDNSHPAMAVRLEACIHCTLCVRACRDVQVNDVIGMAGRGADAHVVFDSGDPMGMSSCVACGECVQACPTGALMPSRSAAEADREVDSICPYCGVGCQLTFSIKDDRIVGVEGRNGPSNLGRLCVKGRFGFDYIHSPERLTRPLIRKDGVAKTDVAIDPANPLTHFREATWEEALERAAAGLRNIRDQRGGGALAGFGSAKGSNEDAYLFQKLVRTGFGTNNVDHCTRLCHASSVAALMETIGSGAVTAPFNEAMNADVIMVIGAHPTSNHPVAATFFKQAVKRGTRLIVADPHGYGLSRHATWLMQMKPASDVALLNSMLHVIVEEGLTDDQYIQAHTENFEALAERVRQFSPEAMQAITNVPAATVREAARAFATAKSAMVFWGMGVTQHIHGTDNARCLISLCLATGQVGRPGAGLHPLRGQNNVQGASDTGLIPMVYPDYKPVGSKEVREFYEEFWGASLDPDPGLTVVEITDAIHKGDIRGVYIMGENPAMSDPDAGHARAALAKLDHLVVQDIFLTETACFADVVLPASAWPEKDGTVTNTNRQVQIGRAAVPPPGDARRDLWIIQQMANRLGLDWHYGTAADVFAEMRECMPSIHGITWERLQAENSVTYPCREEGDPGTPILFGDAFPTPDGRGKFVPCDIISPDEVPDEAYPMVFMTGRLLEHWHTGAMTRRSEHLDLLEPEAVAHLSPSDLARLGIDPGDRIRLESRRGAIELTARSDVGVQPGAVFVPFCFAEAAANLLTNPALDPYGKIPEVKYCAVRITPAGHRTAAE